MNTKALVIATLASILGLAATQSLAASLPRLQFVTGEVQVIDLEGKTRPIIKGEVLLPGEKLTTGSDGMAQLKVFGQGVVALRKSSEIELMPLENDQYVISLDKGLIRTVTLLPGASGNIKIKTPGADIQVTAGDNQTAINKGENGEESTINQVLAGDVKIKVAGVERNSKVGSVVQIASIGRNIVALRRTPGFMRLRVPPITRPGSKGLAGKRADSRLQTSNFIAERGITPPKGLIPNIKVKPGPVIRPFVPPRTDPVNVAKYDGAKTLQLKIGSSPNDNETANKRGITPPKGLIPNIKVKPGPVIRPFVPPRTDPVITTKYDGIKVLDPRISSGSPDDMTAINDTLVVSLKSVNSKTPSFVPVNIQSPSIRADLTKKAEIVNLIPTATSVNGLTVFSNDKIRDLKVLTYPTDRLETDKILSDTVKNSSTIRCGIKCGANTNVSFIPPKKK